MHLITLQNINQQKYASQYTKYTEHMLMIQGLNIDVEFFYKHYLGDNVWDFSGFSPEQRAYLNELVKYGRLQQRQEQFEYHNKLVESIEKNALVFGRKSEKVVKIKATGNVKKNQPYYQQFKKGKFYG